MLLFVQLLHIFLSFFLILIILLQPGKDSGAVFGGQSGNSTYSARSNANPLGRATTIVAVVFMVTSITLAYFSTPEAKEGSNVADRTQEIAKKIAKDDLEFKVPKLPNVQPSMLMKPAPIPEPILENIEGEAVDSNEVEVETEGTETK
jgi:preprotein translocase subunit SecG